MQEWVVMMLALVEAVKNLNIAMVDKKITPEIELQRAVELAKSYSSQT
jgi:hypothetical protein